MTTAGQRQRGAATLAVTFILLFAMTLLALYANRNQVFEQRASANQYRATQAFEAAEAGLEWATAMLNDPRLIDAHCHPSPGTATSFRDRYLIADTAAATQLPVTWSDAGAIKALHAVCIRQDAGWDCACPATGLAAPSGTHDVPAPAFSVHFALHSRAGVIRVIATGCTSLLWPCASTEGPHAEASKTIEVALGVLPAIATPPNAPLTVLGDIGVASAAPGFRHSDAATGGVTVHAGGSFNAPNARLESAPGAPPTASIIEGDEALKGMAADRFFASLFGIEKTSWRQHPAVQSLRCGADCGSTVQHALDDLGSNRMVWIQGDMRVQGPAVIGSVERPVVIVASGAMEFDGDVIVHGLAYAAKLAWHNTTVGTGLLQGAAVSEAGYSGEGSPDFVYDAALLRALKSRSGTFTRVPGSWRDF